MVIGLLLALPVGPTVILCIRYSLSLGALTGLMTGAGAGLADAIYGVAAGYSALALMQLLQSYDQYLHLSAGAVLLCMGYASYTKKAEIKNKLAPPAKTLIRLFFTTFALTISSPLTFIGVSALCASYQVDDHIQNLWGPWMLGLGLFIGSCLWWATLSFTLTMFKKKIAYSFQRYIFKGSGAVLFAMGLSLVGYSAYLFFIS